MPVSAIIQLIRILRTPYRQRPITTFGTVIVIPFSCLPDCLLGLLIAPRSSYAPPICVQTVVDGFCDRNDPSRACSWALALVFFSYGSSCLCYCDFHLRALYLHTSFRYICMRVCVCRFALTPVDCVRPCGCACAPFAYPVFRRHRRYSYCCCSGADPSIRFIAAYCTVIPIPALCAAWFSNQQQQQQNRHSFFFLFTIAKDIFLLKNVTTLRRP